MSVSSSQFHTVLWGSWSVRGQVGRVTDAFHITDATSGNFLIPPNFCSNDGKAEKNNS